MSEKLNALSLKIRSLEEELRALHLERQHTAVQERDAFLATLTADQRLAYLARCAAQIEFNRAGKRLDEAYTAWNAIKPDLEPCTAFEAYVDAE